METDEQGVLSVSELVNVSRAWISQVFPGDLLHANWGDYGELMLEAARAQHAHDVATVREIEVRNPYLGGGGLFLSFLAGNI